MDYLRALTIVNKIQIVLAVAASIVTADVIYKVCVLFSS